MAADAERIGIGRTERISAMTILRGAISRLWRGGWRVALLWLVIFGVGVGQEPLRKLISIDQAATSPGYWAYLAATMGVGAVLGGLATRLMIAGPVGWLRMDRGLGEYALIMLAMALVLAGIGAGSTAAVGRQAQVAYDSEIMLGLGLATMVAYGAAMWAWFRLGLWPVARLMGRRMTAGKAWPLMRRATRGLVFAYGIVGLPILILVVGAYATGGQQGIERVPGWAQQLTVACWGILAYGMIATIYELRVENPANVAAVFD